MIFSWRELPPTPGQTLAIARLCMALRIRPELEWLPRNRMETRNLMYGLHQQLRLKGRNKVGEVNRKTRQVNSQFLVECQSCGAQLHMTLHGKPVIVTNCFKCYSKNIKVTKET